MALTYANLHRRSIGGDFLVVESLTPAASDYVTGGYVFDTTVGGMLTDGIIKAVFDAGHNNGTAVTSTVVLKYNYSTAKLQAFVSNSTSALAEAANGADLSAYVFVIVAVGK